MKPRQVKTNKFSFSKLFWIACFPVLTVLSTACNNDDDVTPVEPIPLAYVSLYHDAPNGPALNIRADDNLVNLDPLEYTEYTGYLRFYTGNRALKFTPYNASNTVLDTTVNFVEDKFYSVFAIGDASNLGALVVMDSIPNVSAGNALIRVVHLSPDAPAVSVTTTSTGDNMPSFDSLTYKTASQFQEVTAGTTSFELTAVGGSDVLASVSNVFFQEGRVYTIVVRGYYNPSAGNTNGLSVQVTSNFIDY